MTAVLALATLASVPWVRGRWSTAMDSPSDGPAPGAGPATSDEQAAALSVADFRNVLAFRTALRRFLHWSQTEARAAGLTPNQHQLLIAIKGHPGAQGPAVSDLAGYLLLRHHSVVELIDRAALAGLVERHPDPGDRRVTRTRLTANGEARLRRLAPAHFDELRTLAPVLDQVVATWAAGTRRETSP